jgi:hypothetical protein
MCLAVTGSPGSVAAFITPTPTPTPAITETPSPTPILPAAPTELQPVQVITAPPEVTLTPDPNVTAFFAPTPATPPTLDPSRCVTRWLIPNPPDVCAASAGASPALWQPFERGWMVHVAQLNRVYILYADGTYASVVDRWERGMPEDDPALEAPSGLYEPVRELGYVWREHGLGASLGWATAPEVSYQAISQCEIPAPETICYLTGPNDEVIRMRGNTPTWSWWGG